MGAACGDGPQANPCLLAAAPPAAHAPRAAPWLHLAALSAATARPQALQAAKRGPSGRLQPGSGLCRVDRQLKRATRRDRCSSFLPVVYTPRCPPPRHGCAATPFCMFRCMQACVHSCSFSRRVSVFDGMSVTTLITPQVLLSSQTRGAAGATTCGGTSSAAAVCRGRAIQCAPFFIFSYT